MPDVYEQRLCQLYDRQREGLSPAASLPVRRAIEKVRLTAAGSWGTAGDRIDFRFLVIWPGDAAGRRKVSRLWSAAESCQHIDASP